MARFFFDVFDDEDFKAANANRDIAKYRQYLYGQVRELLTGYGKIDYIFFDFSYASNRHPEIWGGKGPDDWGSQQRRWIEQLIGLFRVVAPGRSHGN